MVVVVCVMVAVVCYAGICLHVLTTSEIMCMAVFLLADAKLVDASFEPNMISKVDLAVKRKKSLQ